eukprot:2353591-Amphidinium_carterae.1
MKYAGITALHCDSDVCGQAVVVSVLGPAMSGHPKSLIHSRFLEACRASRGGATAWLPSVTLPAGDANASIPSTSARIANHEYNVQSLTNA